MRPSPANNKHGTYNVKRHFFLQLQKSTSCIQLLNDSEQNDTLFNGVKFGDEEKSKKNETKFNASTQQMSIIDCHASERTTVANEKNQSKIA